MAKRKKTREQKILAEIHRRQHLASPQEYSLGDTSKHHKSISEVSPTKTVTVLPPAAIHQQDFHIHDLKKTLLVTVIIILMQLLLYFILNK